MKKIDYNIYLKKLKGCYLGKCVGGTLGMPYEGDTNTHNLTFYDPIPTEMCGNDDVDLQVIYVETLYRYGFPVNRHHLAKGWKHMHFGPDEYGVAKYHLAQGLFPPVSGAFENEFKNCMGAVIRSELWASLAPGNPELAVSFAKEDACIDHASDGVNSAVFLTALESAAYTERNRDKLLEIAFSFIPQNSTLYLALHDVISQWQSGKTLFETREIMVKKYATSGWTESVINICFVLIGWLYGEGDFGKSICAAVNCGYDADCTGATLGALLGIINPDSIDEKWTKPIGSDVILSGNIIGIHIADTIDKFCDRIANLAVKAEQYYNSDVTFYGLPENIQSKIHSIPVWTKNYKLIKNHTDAYDSLISATPLLVNLSYPEEIAHRGKEPLNYTLHIANPTEFTVNTKLDIRLPEGFFIDYKFKEFSLTSGEEISITFNIRTDKSIKLAMNNIEINLTLNGLDYRLCAPVIVGVPWVNSKTNELEFSNGFIKSIPSGEQEYRVYFKTPNPSLSAIACVATREVEVYINGKEIISGDTSDVVPSIHRGSARPVKIKNTFNEAVIRLKDGKEGKFFFAVGDLDSWIWNEKVEWKPFMDSKIDK